ncbi:hypothetical protein HF086_012144 [Spodoptera exigua]|uniref:N-terminal acetyltransferase B complex subunit MDM20 homolog n=1 Tax=Spodoptera exigua TaxID=7107 RepID=A0A922M7J0_SPOEX|nr:hypothetical protein HF086_012144 [Spodoptera exigua]
MKNGGAATAHARWWNCGASVATNLRFLNFPDWLDIGNNKKALQEAEKVLKKTPTLQAARALKALALFRLGKGLEAQVVLDALADEKPSDDTTLQAMTISYRESQQLHKVCMLYENAVKSEPTNEELHSHLFMSYVRVGDYRSQQRAAMALYKFAPKNPYYFWAVMSIVLQAKTSEDNTKRGILLALAQRMVDNFISENKMEAEQEARLYIMILELQEKWEDILKFIESPLYSQLVPGSTAQASIPYLKKLGQWKRLNVVCKELLWDNQDRWDYYVPYFDSVFYLMKENEEDADSSIDNTAEKCHEFICQLVESMSSGRTLRGPYLARLELWKRLAVDGDPTSLIGSGLSLCVQYLRVFANKPCAVPDLRPYLGMIPQKEREEKCREFLTCLGFDENSEPESSSAPIVEALCLLELVLHHSPANFHAKLLLVKLYHLLAADSIYQRLEVKHIQLVSLGWLHCARLAPACLASRALQLLADTRAFLKHHGKDYGTFEKLVELSAWAARLEACAWGAAAARHQALLAQLAGPPALLHQPSRLPAQPTDNRDLNVIVNYEPPQFQDENLKARTFDQEVSYLRLKDALVSAIALCIELADSRPFIGIITFLLGVCNELFSPASAKKSKKKTSHSPDEIKTSELLNELNNAVQTSITFLEHILDEWPKYEVSNMDEILAKLTLDDKYQSPVENKLKTGRDDMLNDVRNILKRKSKYLKSLLQ